MVAIDILKLPSREVWTDWCAGTLTNGRAFPAPSNPRRGALTSYPDPCDHVPIRSWPLYRARAVMGSVGDAYDNAMAESFFASLECELIDRRSWKSYADASANDLRLR